MEQITISPYRNESRNHTLDTEPSVEYSLDPPGITVWFPWAASRIVDLIVQGEEGQYSKQRQAVPRTTELLYLEPNLNVLEPSVVVPVLKGTVEAGITLWTCAVRAGNLGSVLNDDTPVLSIAPDGTLSLSHESIQAPLRFFIGALE